MEPKDVEKVLLKLQKASMSGRGVRLSHHQVLCLKVAHTAVVGELHAAKAQLTMLTGVVQNAWQTVEESASDIITP